MIGGGRHRNSIEGRFGPDMMSVFDNWDEFCGLQRASGGTDALDMSSLQTGFRSTANPPSVLTTASMQKRRAWRSLRFLRPLQSLRRALSGPFDDIPIVGTSVDWEVELVAVVGRQADNVLVEDAWSFIAGLTVGQDISDRKLQMAAADSSRSKNRIWVWPDGAVDRHPRRIR